MTAKLLFLYLLAVTSLAAVQAGKLRLQASV
jgi:hypothetical protein